MAQYKILIALSASDDLWFTPSEVGIDCKDVEPSLDFAIKTQRFIERMFGLATKREEV